MKYECVDYGMNVSQKMRRILLSGIFALLAARVAYFQLWQLVQRHRSPKGIIQIGTTSMLACWCASPRRRTLSLHRTTRDVCIPGVLIEQYFTTTDKPGIF